MEVKAKLIEQLVMERSLSLFSCYGFPEIEMVTEFIKYHFEAEDWLLWSICNRVNSNKASLVQNIKNKKTKQEKKNQGNSRSVTKGLVAKLTSPHAQSVWKSKEKEFELCN